MSAKVLATVTALVRLVVAAAAVNVAVQVMLSFVCKFDKVPLGADRSVMSKPATASLNTMVTTASSPTLRDVSSIVTELTVGRRTSIV